MKKNFLLLGLSLLTAVSASAYNFYATNDDGVTIYYNRVGDDGAAVTFQTSKFNSYSGNVVIPSTVNDNGTTRNVVEIGAAAFRDCEDLSSVTMPTSLTKITYAAFYNCPKLSSVNIPYGVESLGFSAFQQCSKLSSVSIPATVKQIDQNCFDDCSSLAKFTIECTTLPTVADILFANASIGNATLWVPKGCEELYSNASPWKSFDQIKEMAYDFTAINQEDVLMYYVFSDNNSVRVSNRYPDGGDSYPIQVMIPKAVMHNGIKYTVSGIADRAFNWCEQLKYVFIPRTVTYIGEFAFFGCLSLKEVCIDFANGNAITMPNRNGMFEYVDLENACLYVPIGAKATYSTVTPWMYFGHIYETDLFSGVSGVVADPETDGAYFDLYGRRVDNPTRGLFIRNGKKVILK